MVTTLIKLQSLPALLMVVEEVPSMQKEVKVGGLISTTRINTTASLHAEDLLKREE